MKTFIFTLSIALFLMIGDCAAKQTGKVFSNPNERRESANLKSNKIVRGALGDKIDEYLKRTVPFGFSGAILVAKNGEIVLHKGYGLADRKRRVPVTTDTIFYIGSITKQFTAAAILKLEMQGKLFVTDTLDKHFKDVPPDKAGITIHQLLSHSSGLGSADDLYSSAVSKDEQFRRVMAMKLRTEPGKEYFYSNPGFNLLGMIVENVSGQPYEKYLYENLFKPAGMFKTGYQIPKWEKDKFAHGYSGDVDKGSPLDRPYWLVDGPSWGLRGAGAMHSTLADLYRWHLELKKDDILSVKAKRKLFSPHVKMNSNSFYGYGWTVQKTPRNTNLIEHNGSDGIFYADFHRYIDEDTVVIGVTNDIYGQGIIESKVSEIVFGNNKIQFPPVASAKPVSSAILQKYLGEYQLPSGATINVALKNNRLVLDPIGQEAVSILTDVQPSQAENFVIITAKTEEILGGAIKNDFTALKANIPEKSFEVYKTFLTEVLDLSKDNGSSPAQYKIIGTRPLWLAPDEPVTTFVRVKNKEGSVLILITWENNLVRGRGVTTETDDTTLRTPFVARSQKSFAGFHTGLEKTTDINFKLNQKGVAAAIEFQTAQGIRIAQRMNDPKK